MSAPTGNQSWLIHVGIGVIEKKAKDGVSSLSPNQRLVYCLWVTDYCMRNSGDLTQVDDLYKGCLFEATRLAQLLSLAFTNESFSLPQAQLEAEYLSRFERICNEVTESRLN